MGKIFAAGALLALSMMASHASDPVMRRDILGVHLDMTKEEAKTRLAEIGTFEREERKQQEIWQVRDPSFSHVMIGMSKEGKLRYITAIARDDEQAKRVAYSSVGDLKQARQVGDASIKNFKYEWALPAAGDQPETLVVASGRDEDALRSLSLKRASYGAPSAPEDE